MSPHVLAIDQGTSATKCVLVDEGGAIVARASAPLGERYPQPGWVEQDPQELWLSVQAAVKDCLAQGPGVRVAAVGLSTQRESALVWRRRDAQALTPLLSWQDQRTVALREQIGAAEVDAMVRERTGLPLDPMFSALKLRWLLDEIDPGRTQSRSGAWCVGTVDAYLLARLGAEGVVEVGNASRTQLLRVDRAAWDEDLLQLFGIPSALLPRVARSCTAFADAGALHAGLRGVPVHAVMADSHSALFAHGVYEPGAVKATLGTGSSVMGLTGSGQGVHPGICRTLAWDAGQGPVLALEGNIRAAGATLRWVAELFGVTPGEAAEIAARHAASGTVTLVPGFNGLGAPWWDPRAVGLVTGLSLDTRREHFFVAALESIAHQVCDVVEAMQVSGAAVERLLLDGGPSHNAQLRDLVSACIDRPVVHCTDVELSALGVAHLAGRAVGVWDDAALRALPRGQQVSRAPSAPATVRAARQRWLHAVAQSRLAS